MGMSERARKRAREREEARRVQVQALLRNPLRRRILEILKRRPGMNRQQLARELGINLNGVGYHIERLEKVRLVALRPGLKDKETLCFTAENVELWEKKSLRVLFGSSRTSEVGLFLAQNPGAGPMQVAHALDLSVHTVRRHVRRLEDSGLVQRLRVDRQVEYHAEPALVSWVETIGKHAVGELGAQEPAQDLSDV